ncbi:MAG: type II secretion system protein GspG [Acidobacteriota bacterium]|nr:MAG: type II secretion system protein GspG [Acidobacteriota bacterium]
MLLAIGWTLLGCTEQRASHDLERTLAARQEEPLEEVRADLERVVRDWPGTKAATKAQQELQWIDDLLAATVRGPMLRAWDSVREVGEAAERFKLDHQRYPSSFSELVPTYLRGVVRDPWGHHVRYRRAGHGYQVVCYGEDGLPGGTGTSTDVLIENGERVRVGAAGSY